MNRSLEIRTIEGPIAVSYKKRGAKHYCTALEFDLVGIGTTRKKAFDELKNVIIEYFEEIMKSRGPVAFFNPSEAKEWNTRDKEYYRIVAVVLLKDKETTLPKSISDIKELRSYRHRIKSFDLCPLSV